MIVMCAKRVFGNVHVAHKKFGSNEGTIGICKRGGTITDRFDFGAGQLNACSYLLDEKVFVGCPFISYVYGFLHLFFFGHQHDTHIMVGFEVCGCSKFQIINGYRVYTVFKRSDVVWRIMVEVK